MKRRRNQNALLSAENAKKEMQDLQADNQRILQARLERDTMLKKLVK
jgi:F-type H+-transporting ATPase subunit b